MASSFDLLWARTCLPRRMVPPSAMTTSVLGGKTLNAGIEKMMEMKQLHDPEFHRAEQHADQIKDESPQ